VKKYLQEKTKRNAPLRLEKARDKKGRLKGNPYQGIGARQIAEFLSKNGKVVSHNKVANNCFLASC